MNGLSLVTTFTLFNYLPLGAVPDGGHYTECFIDHRVIMYKLARSGPLPPYSRVNISRITEHTSLVSLKTLVTVSSQTTYC